MSNFKEKCFQYFGTSNFYEVLGIDENATGKEIKKAYHKMSLLVHPDRVDENQKEICTEKFKVLGRIHSILQDKEKRKVYNDCGDFDDESYSTFNWSEYWTSMFKKIELADIQKYEKEYIGSEAERKDIKRAYESGKGDMNIILELVAFSNCDSEPRIINIVREMVGNGEVEEFDCFFNESKAKKCRRHRKWAKEAEEVSKNFEDLQKELDANRKARAESFGSFFAALEAKYTTKARKSITAGSNQKSKRLRKK
ncbi:J domain-containing protein CG6693 [Dendroctonus ponderosae]|uniref:J domain-containing protein n=2 Tax=Dendroctonus ponderosae TaxID=77166 RepID=A0AAR5P2J2_DENPD|nr:J domain-containing protein CG6693 [Dendroctonus ponderosae]KAH1022447.1 hypothetical protein HUJ04_011849 [Dendroctonus ponderosae]KAH1022448.1 hypothetical protein HUJ04_011849 [Dendroctonus ponderosae]